MLPDPLAEIEYRRQLCREAFERGRALGDREGYERARAEQAADWHAVAHPASRGGESHATYEERRWGPLGLPEPGMIHLGGTAVHHHPPCFPVCYSYKPGWYPAQKAEKILAAISAAIAERDRRPHVRAAA